MKYFKNTTQIPNEIINSYLPILSGAEFKVLIIITKQTLGWIDKNTGERKISDWISHSQFIKKTGLSKRAITRALSTLLIKNLILVKNNNGKVLTSNFDRKGKTKIIYSLNLRQFCLELESFWLSTNAKLAHNKTYSTKPTYTKQNYSNSESMEEIIQRSYAKFLSKKI